MIPTRAIERYRKTLALAERGATEGERAAARTALATMVARYPGIAAEAGIPDVPPVPPRASRAGPGDFTGAPPGTGAPGGFPFDAHTAWKIGQDMWSAFREAKVAAEAAENLRELVEEHVGIQSRITDADVLIVSVRVERRGRRALRKRDIWTIAQQIGSEVADEFMAAMEEEAEEEAAPSTRRSRAR